MKNYFKTTHLLLFLLGLSFGLRGQNVGINTKTPQSTLHVKFDANKPENDNTAPGIIAPILKFSELLNYLHNYENEQTGLIIYISEIDATSNSPKVTNITSPGYYYFDGFTFYGYAKPTFHQTLTQAWFDVATDTGATDVDQDIYQDGQVGIGKIGVIDSNAQLEITSTNKGLIIPRLTTDQRNSISNPTVSMMIWNIDENCFNFYKNQEKGWKSICENTGEAEFTIMDCQNAKINGEYIVGQAVNTTNYIQLTVNVTEKGTYNIEGTTTLGLYFQRNGSFPSTGIFTIIIPAFGSPTTATAEITPPQTNLIDLKINNSISPCHIPITTILPASVKYKLNTNVNPFIIADNINKGESTHNKKITLKLDVEVAGTTNIKATDQENFDLVYNAYNQNLSVGLQDVILYANGATVPSSYAPTELQFKLEGLGLTTTNNNDLFNINLGTNEAIATCAPNSKVNGEYIAGKPLTASNTLTVNVNVTKTGSYQFIATNTQANIKFTASGTFTTLGPQTFTAVASTINPGPIGAITNYSLSSTLNSQPSCNFDLDIIYPAVKVLLFGTNATYVQQAIKNTTNFGPNGTFKVESLAGTTTLDVSATLTAASLKTYINTQNYQIIVLPFGMRAIPDDAQQVLADFINLKKGVVIYSGSSDQENNIKGTINKLFPNNTIQFDNSTYNARAAILPYISNPSDKNYKYIHGNFDKSTNGLGGKYYMAYEYNSWFGVKPETLPSGLNAIMNMPQVGANTNRAVILHTDNPGLFVMPTYKGYFDINYAYGFNNPISASTAPYGTISILTGNSISNGTLGTGSTVNWPLMGNILSESIKHIYLNYNSTLIIN